MPNRRKERYILNCVVCNTQIISKNPDRKCCSHTCVGIHLRKPDFVCQRCGKSYRKEGVVRSKFCSQDCYFEDLRSRPKTTILNKHEKICQNCGKTYSVWNYRKDESMFCSMKCNREFKKCEKFCKNCGNLFRSEKNQNRIYCSQECAQQRVARSISKGEIELREELKKFFPEIQSNRSITCSDGLFNVDIVYGKKIIEYQGDYWHCNPKKYKPSYFHKGLNITAKEKWERDRIKKELIESVGYIVYYVWEHDFNKNKSEEIEKCINFLKSE